MNKHGTISKYRDRHEPCRCDECVRANSSYARAYREKLKNEVWILKQQPCEDCGERYHPICMTYDHRPGTIKVASVSDLVRWGHRNKVFEEIEKCDLVCANCHALRTMDRNIEAWREDHRSKDVWESNSRQKLNPSLAKEIYDLAKNSPLTRKEIARDYGISHWTVTDILRGKRWPEIERA